MHYIKRTCKLHIADIQLHMNDIWITYITYRIHKDYICYIQITYSSKRKYIYHIQMAYNYIQITFRLHMTHIYYIQITYKLYITYRLHIIYIPITYGIHMISSLLQVSVVHMLHMLCRDLHTDYIQCTYEKQILQILHMLHVSYIQFTYKSIKHSRKTCSCADTSLPIAGHHSKEPAGCHASCTAASAG